MALYDALWTHFPEPPNKHSSVVFHLTLAGHHPSDLDSIAAVFEAAYGARLPIQAVACELRLYARRGEGWTEAAAFPFNRAAHLTAR
jgi:hypothetical protein